eukprot:gene5186-7030_t
MSGLHAVHVDLCLHRSVKLTPNQHEALIGSLYATLLEQTQDGTFGTPLRSTFSLFVPDIDIVCHLAPVTAQPLIRAKYVGKTSRFLQMYDQRIVIVCKPPKQELQEKAVTLSSRYLLKDSSSLAGVKSNEKSTDYPSSLSTNVPINTTSITSTTAPSMMTTVQNPTKISKADINSSPTVSSKVEDIVYSKQPVPNCNHTKESSKSKSSIIKALTKSEIKRLVNQVMPTLKGIFKGEIPNWRHEAFKRGKSDRRNLKLATHFGALTAKQQDFIMSCLSKVFCAKSNKYLPYVMDVILPVLVIELYSKVLDISIEEAQEELRRH